MTGENNEPLTVMHKDDFRCVAMAMNPELTDEDFEREWLEFIAEREKHYRMVCLN